MPVEVHHDTPRCRGGSDDPSNLVPMCKWCHIELHRVDREMHLPGWLGLKAALGDRLAQHMGSINRPYRERLRRQLGEAGLRARMSELGKAGNRKRWGRVRPAA